MNITSEELMYNDFIKSHYRRMLLTLDTKFNAEDMTDIQAKEDLLKILSVKKSKSKIFKLPAHIYKISAIAASIVFIASIFLFNSSDESSSIQTSETKSIVNDTNKVFNDYAAKTLENAGIHENLIKIVDSIKAPKHFSISQENFGFNQESAKQEFSGKSFVDLIIQQFPEYNFTQLKTKLVSRKYKDKTTGDFYRFSLEFYDGKIMITQEISSNSLKSKANENALILKNSLEKYLNEIAR